MCVKNSSVILVYIVIVLIAFMYNIYFISREDNVFISTSA